MSKTFSMLTLSTIDDSCSESFICPGIPYSVIHTKCVEIKSPSLCGRRPDDFMRDHDDQQDIRVEYAAYSYGGGAAKTLTENETLAIALIFNDAGEIADAFGAFIDPVESASFITDNPFYENRNDEE